MWNAVGKFLRSNALGLVAIFIALGGTAAAVSTTRSTDRSRPASDKTVAVVAKKGKRGPRGPAGPPGPAGQNGAPGQPGASGPGAKRLDFDQPETDNTLRLLATIDELTISARCSQNGGDSNISLVLTSTTPAVWNGSSIESGSSQDPTPSNFGRSLVADTPLQVYGNESPPGGFVRADEQAIYRSATRTIVVWVHLLADDSAARCQVFGAAVPAT